MRAEVLQVYNPRWKIPEGLKVEDRLILVRRKNEQPEISDQGYLWASLPNFPPAVSGK